MRSLHSRCPVTSSCPLASSRGQPPSLREASLHLRALVSLETGALELPVVAELLVRTRRVPERRPVGQSGVNCIRIGLDLAGTRETHSLRPCFWSNEVPH